MRLIFIRHADPDYPNNTLTEKGFIEAKALGEKYSADDYDLIYSSPLNRAKITCDNVVKGKKEVRVVDWLKEFNYRVIVDGKDQIPWDFYPKFLDETDLSKENYLDTDILKEGHVKEGYEYVTGSFDKVLEENGYKRDGRTYKVLEENTKTIVFFCHFGVMSVLLSHLFNIPFTVITNHFCCLPTGVTTVVTEERKKGTAQFRMLCYSDVSHLKERGIEPSFAGRFCETYSSPDRH